MIPVFPKYKMFIHRNGEEEKIILPWTVCMLRNSIIKGIRILILKRVSDQISANEPNAYN